MVRKRSKKRSQSAQPARPSQSQQPAQPAAAPLDQEIPELGTVHQVADLLKVSRNTVDRLAKKGELPGRCRVGMQVRYDMRQVRAWLAAKLARGD